MSNNFDRAPYLPFPTVHLKPSKKKSDCGLFSFPKDILVEICKNLPDKEILSISQTCRTLYDELSEDYFWMALSKHKEKLEFENFDRQEFPSVKYWHFAQLKLDPIIESDVHYMSRITHSASILLIGSSKVGKTQLLEALLGHDFSDTYLVTQLQMSRTVYWRQASRYAQIQIWDTAGDVSARNGNLPFYRKANIVLMLYSVADSKSFRALKGFYADTASYCLPEVTRILVSTFNDVPEDQHQVKSEEGAHLAKQCHMPFVEVSSKSKQGLRLLKKLIMDHLDEKKQRGTFSDRTFFS